MLELNALAAAPAEKMMPIWQSSATMSTSIACFLAPLRVQVAALHRAAFRRGRARLNRERLATVQVGRLVDVGQVLEPDMIEREIVEAADDGDPVRACAASTG